MSELSEIRSPTPPVTVNFHWTENGPKQVVHYEGSAYEYGTTAIKALVQFEANNVLHQHVEAPAGVEVLEYRWDFGDGSVGFGPVVSHQFEVVQPDIEISLTVVDSLSRLAFATKTISLITLAFGFIAPNVMRAQGSGAERITQERTAHDGGWAEHSVVDVAAVTKVSSGKALAESEDIIQEQFTVTHIRKGKLSLFVDKFVVDTASATLL